MTDVEKSAVDAVQEETPAAAKEIEKDRRNPFQADQTEDNNQLILPELPLHKRDRSDENLRNDKGGVSSPASPLYRQDRALSSFGGSSFVFTRISKLNELRA